MFETFGAINDEGARVLSQLARFAAKRAGKEFSSFCGRAWVRFSCNLQRSVSQSILNRIDGSPIDLDDDASESSGMNVDPDLVHLPRVRAIPPQIPSFPDPLGLGNSTRNKRTTSTPSPTFTPTSTPTITTPSASTSTLSLTHTLTRARMLAGVEFGAG